ncbi:MAG: hypothetical protein OIF50_08935 [Flavobacteriaceae bacterium]|nr:hypothetical protein [Flavobacteriaceae bacterium]
MKKFLLLCVFLLMGKLCLAQNVLEYHIDTPIRFQAYKEQDKLYRPRTLTDYKQNTPEAAAQSYFFAISNAILSKLYFDQSNYTEKEDSDFVAIKKTPINDAYIQILHKTSYTFSGKSMAYIMFIARVKGINYYFPTLLSLIKKEGKWYIHKRPNQKKLNDCLMMFKPCVMSCLVEGKSPDKDVELLIRKTKSKSNTLDFVRLFDELVAIQNNESLSTKLTMTENLDCKEIDSKQEVTGNAIFTGLYKDVNFKMFDKPNDKWLSKVDKGQDSIVLTSKLSFHYANKEYSALKFKRIQPNGKIAMDYLRLDNNQIEKQAEELLILYEQLSTKIFSDLSPSMVKKNIMNSDLYKRSRGVYEVLNISKLFQLFQENKAMFKVYMNNI